MTTRRDFFKQFIGQVGVLRDDFMGVENIPLNRLNELPKPIIEQIEPVFFPDEKWYLQDGILALPSGKSNEIITIQLNEIEFSALKLFKKRINLKQASLIISKNNKIPFNDIYQTVTSLFFKLANLGICHPREAYQINEILNMNKNPDEE